MTDVPADTAVPEAPPAPLVEARARTSCRSPRTWMKPVGVALVVAAVVLAIPATPLGRYLAYDDFQALVGSAGLWAPLLFLGVFTVGAVFLAPASVMAFAGAAVFSTPVAMALLVAATNLGASAAFLVGRWAGRDLVEARLSRSRWFSRIDQALVKNGFFAILLLRVIFAPYNVLNYVASFTHLRYRDYVLGTFFGMLPVIFVWVFLGDVIGRVWQTGDLRPLWSPSTVVAGIVFAACVGLPLVARRRRRPL